MGEVSIAGQGLACALGLGLKASVARIAQGPPTPKTLALPDGLSAPYFAIPFQSEQLLEPDQWTARAKHLVQQVVAECFAGLDGKTTKQIVREAPLFIATSSLIVGRLENGASFPVDAQHAVEEIASWIGWQGPVFWVSSACTSAVNALLSAQQWVASGQTRQALVLGIELQNLFSPMGFSTMQLLTANTPRPLDAHRDGLALGETVAAVLLSDQPSRWQLLGGANQVYGANPLGADEHVLANVIRQSLVKCHLEAANIDIIKLHAAGSPQTDATEVLALRQVFHTTPALTTLKAYLGHTLGACGAAELTLLTACLEANVCPDSRASHPDPNLGVQACRSWPQRRNVLLLNTLGFGGGHACLLVASRNTIGTA
jgi:3-oxoacyl-[acyl-carrier-protein] synthase I